MCSEWNRLVSGTKTLYKKRNQLDCYERIVPKGIFSLEDAGIIENPFGIYVGAHGDNILVCDYGNHRILVFHKDGQFITTFGSYGNEIGQFSHPGAFCVLESKIFVVDRDNKRIQIFDSNYHSIGSFDVYYKPCNICCSKQGFIVVSTHDGTIMVFDSNGKSGYTISSWIQQNEIIGCFDGIACNSVGNIILSDLIGNRIHVLASNGDLLFSFGKQKIYEPRGICVDEYDNIFVCDSIYKRIVIFNRGGIFIQYVPVMASPCSVFVSRRKMFVTCSPENIIYVFSNK